MSNILQSQGPYNNFIFFKLKLLKFQDFYKDMKDRTFNNADSFAMSFDEEWQRIECDDISIKIKKIIEILSDHPFVKSNPDTAFKIANFRIKSLGKFK